MKIAIDASRANRKNRTGVEWYSYHLIQELKKLVSGDTKLLLYTGEKLTDGLEDCPDGVIEKVLSWPPKYLWTQLRLWLELVLHAPDVLFVPAHTIPFLPIRPRGFSIISSPLQPGKTQNVVINFKKRGPRGPLPCLVSYSLSMMALCS